MDSGFDNSAKLRAPAELLGLPPRKAKIYTNDGRYALALAIVTIFGPILLLGQYCLNDIKQFHERSSLRSSGREVVGEVTGIVVERGGATSVKYAFVDNGREYSGQARIPSDFGPELHQSDKLRVKFLPSDPVVNHPSDWEWSAWMGLDKALFSLVFVAMGCVAMTMLGRERKLAREGLAVAATVKSCMPKADQFQIQYEFRIENGERMVGRATSKEPFEVGSYAWVLYLASKPRRNQMYPLSMYKVAD